MSEGALDLSLSSYEVNSQRTSTSRSHDQVSSDSGRASSDSTSSDIHDDVKNRYRTSPPRMMPSPSGGPPPPLPNGLIPPSDPSSNTNTHQPLGSRPGPKSPVNFPPSPRLRNLPPNLPPFHTQQPPHLSTNAPSPPSRGCVAGRLSNPNSPETPSIQEDEFKPLPLSISNSHPDRGADPRVAPIRPFKMYPVDAFNVYNSQLLPGSGTGLSPSPVGIQSLYESSSPSSFATFPLTPLTSHLLQRKRRAELRENANNTTSGKSEEGGGEGVGEGSPVNALPNSSTSIVGSTGVSSTLSATSSRNNEEDTKQLSDDKFPKLDEKKDEAYWDRRRKNNEAAKRSRDARRQKEEEIAMRAAFLEQENLKLRAQVAILKNETAKLHYMLYNRI